MLVIFLNILKIKPVTTLKYESIAKIQMRTNKASLLWINFPKVISLVCKYTGIFEPLAISNGNAKRTEATVKKINIPDIRTDVIDS